MESVWERERETAATLLFSDFGSLFFGKSVLCTWDPFTRGLYWYLNGTSGTLKGIFDDPPSGDYTTFTPRNLWRTSIKLPWCLCTRENQLMAATMGKVSHKKCPYATGASRIGGLRRGYRLWGIIGRLKGFFLNFSAEMIFLVIVLAGVIVLWTAILITAA